MYDWCVQQQLLNAAKEGDVSKALGLLAQGVSIDSTDEVSESVSEWMNITTALVITLLQPFSINTCMQSL